MILYRIKCKYSGCERVGMCSEKNKKKHQTFSHIAEKSEKKLI